MSTSSFWFLVAVILTAEFDHEWYWRKKLPERKGEKCQVLVRGKNNSVLVRFKDGTKVVTSRFAVRKVKREDER